MRRAHASIYIIGLFLGYTFVVRADEEAARLRGGNATAPPRVALRFALAQTAPQGLR